MTSLAQFFSDEHIIRELCKARVSLAKRRHDALFYHNIDQSQPSPEDIPACWGQIPLSIFPRRKQWHRFRSKKEGRQGSRNVTLDTLTRAIRVLSQETPEADWCKGLMKTVAMIRDKALSGCYEFSEPAIHPALKDSAKRTYRPLAQFSLIDKIISSLTARYLREVLDPAFCTSCLASRPLEGRHIGMDAILERVTGTPLYIAECDIRGFYDCISHDIARYALNAIVEDMRKLNPTFRLDQTALQILEAYFACYSFKRSIRQKAEPKLQSGQPGAKYSWPEDQLHDLHAPGASLDNIGVPQGGALSGVIGNVVMHTADKQIEPFRQDAGVTYLRYVDDMIMLAPDPKVSKAAFAAYCEVVQELKLSIHKPEAVGSYSGENKKRFWTKKSRDVYEWGPASAGCFPWIQFLGYQIRFDGHLRVRPNSVAKESRKLVKQTDKLLRLLKPSNVSNLRRSKQEIKDRLRLQLISMGTARRDLRQVDGPLPMCWAYGFRWQKGKRVFLGNLKSLDRQRERQISRVARCLSTLDFQVPPHRSRDESHLRHYGHLFSYWGQFQSFIENHGTQIAGHNSGGMPSKIA